MKKYYLSQFILVEFVRTYKLEVKLLTLIRQVMKEYTVGEEIYLGGRQLEAD
jgi:hypothetical protein